MHDTRINLMFIIKTLPLANKTGSLDPWVKITILGLNLFCFGSNVIFNAIVVKSSVQKFCSLANANASC